MLKDDVIEAIDKEMKNLMKKFIADTLKHEGILYPSSMMEHYGIPELNDEDFANFMKKYDIPVIGEGLEAQYNIDGKNIEHIAHQELRAQTNAKPFNIFLSKEIKDDIDTRVQFKLRDIDEFCGEYNENLAGRSEAEVEEFKEELYSTLVEIMGMYKYNQGIIGVGEDKINDMRAALDVVDDLVDKLVEEARETPLSDRAETLHERLSDITGGFATRSSQLSAALDDTYDDPDF